MSGFFTQKPWYLMGIVNVTPDSFSDGGRFFDTSKAVAHAKQLVAEGADILDIGGESTRPGAAPVTPGEEQARILPVLEALRGCGAVLSVDTRNAATMRAAIAAGATMLNDVSALTHDPDSMAVAASFGGPVCIMHMKGQPATMQQAPEYTDVCAEVQAYLAARIGSCVAAGIARERLVIDPGIGFGKTTAHNLSLLAGMGAFAALGVPVLLGASRKRFIAALDRENPAQDRLGGSLAAAVAGLRGGARIFRVHDVAQTRQALAVTAALMG